MNFFHSSLSEFLSGVKDASLKVIEIIFFEVLILSIIFLHNTSGISKLSKDTCSWFCSKFFHVH